MNPYFDLLKGVYFFDVLSDEDICRIAAVCREERFSAGDIIFREGDTGDRFFIVLEGRVEIWKDYGTDEMDQLAVYADRQIFGELSLIDNAPRSATVIAGEAVRLLSVKRKDFDRIISGSPSISLSIMRAISSTVRRRTYAYLCNLRKSKRDLKEACERLQAEIEERQYLEERLRHTHKLEAIATLAGGVAHDFNNLLMCIQGNISLILLQTDPNLPAYERLKSIEEYIQSGAALTRRLLGFARNGTSAVTAVVISDLVRRSLENFRFDRDRIRIRETCESCAVMVNPDEMEQMLTHLYQNACEAMPEGGTLHVRAVLQTLSQNEARRLRLKPGCYAVISVADTGIGMDQEMQHRIFDPFFTTKARDRIKGAGLGLASVYSIVKNHGGAIYLDSRRGDGTTFTIYLPAAP